MPNFKFIIKKETGDLQKGNIQANSRDDALSLLKKEGVFILFLEETKKSRLNISPKKISQRDISIFSKQLSIMLQSKITLIESLQIIILEMKNERFKGILVKIIEDIRAGAMFSNALSKHPAIFSDFYINIIRVGESSGALSEALIYLIKHLEEQEQIKSKIKAAMIYPALIIIVMVVIVGVLFLWLLPTHLFPVLEKAGVELPLPTIIVMSFVDFLTGNIIQIILTIILLIVGFFVINKTKGGKYFFHKTYLKIPIIGDLMKKFYMAQFATIFYTSMTSGVSMVESLNMTKKVVGNVVYKESISDFRERIKEGEVLSAAVKKYPLLYSSMFIQMLMVGEKTGLIERSLNNICDIYSEEIDRKIKIGISLMEPAIIIFLAVIVLVIVLSVFLPIIQMTTM